MMSKIGQATKVVINEEKDNEGEVTLVGSTNVVCGTHRKEI